MINSCGLGFSFGNSMFFGHGIFMFIFWILIVVSIVSIFRKFSFGRVGSFRGNKDENCMEILKKRYVNGEITREEYQDIKQKLRD
ncbi:SHOCT domain-containing protein [Fusobacteria bacterium ZRK30]|nr:SHOCT domain-containing protein [Fusobacteria bacterium ZRK30]